MRTTPENITSLEENEIFIFGSNLSGIHGAGAAHTARQWGALMGKGTGIQGKTYAIPTKDRRINTLSIKAINRHVGVFINYARKHSDKKFLVTKIGCGLANLQVSDMAPLFKNALELENVYLPIEFIEFLNSNR